jgi:glucosamine-6-phosphate deaminase
MRLVITKDYNEMSDWGARYIKKRINDFKPGPDRFFVLGLPTGMFKFLVVFFFN